MGLPITKVWMKDSKKVPGVRIDIEDYAFMDCAMLRIRVVGIKNYLTFLAAETNSSSAYVCLFSHRD